MSVAPITWPEGLDRPNLLIFQATPFCNIDCTYCYLPGRNEKNAISAETIARVCDQLVESGGLGSALRVSWHAGEPLAMKKALLASHCALVREKLGAHTKLTLSMQTNATLIDQEWIDIIREHDIRIGISLDGPAEFHDLYRKDRRGAGTHEAAMRGVRLLQAHGIPCVVICVLCEEALNNPDKVFDFFVENNITRVAFNIEESSGANVSRTHRVTNVRALSQSFFRRYFERVGQYRGQHWVRELADVVGSLRKPSTAPRSPASRPGRIISIGAGGQVSTFSPEMLAWIGEDAARFHFANVGREPLMSLTQSQAFQETLASIDAGHEACRTSCEYYAFCGGGAPSVKLAEHGTFSGAATTHCETKLKASVDAVLSLLIEGQQYAQPVDQDVFET